MKRTMLAWGGFVEGGMFANSAPEYGFTGDGNMVAVFTTRACARRHFQDVRRVRITALPNSRIKPKRGRGSK